MENHFDLALTRGESRLIIFFFSTLRITTPQIEIAQIGCSIFFHRAGERVFARALLFASHAADIYAVRAAGQLSTQRSEVNS